MTALFGLKTILGQNEKRARLLNTSVPSSIWDRGFLFASHEAHDSSSISIAVLSTTLGLDLKLEVSVRINGYGVPRV